ncbi:Fe(3+) dicitrate ABC transporter permease FecD [Bacillus sp. LBG-1-113]|uniref:Fe(3+) dicitrate ABC transporter permease FecD n=1 Tax=Bacillus sp. LBG-1-113 TaxID=2886094 RepID=UPI001E5BD2A4|nr:Fe(3+) dicitrate ABC transporter permease FecD [Bacillus sp. LBG-1-113]MCC2930365.1 Fe(3+) dicitrate ABC transporter permease FecD [Bacillus sp. LBG-1-113]
MYYSAKRRSSSRLMVFIIALIILIFGLGLNLSVGASDIGIIDALTYLFVWDGSKEQLIISTLRLPRTLIGVFVGASLAVAGALMQAMTRNPLASPQIFGVNAGASLFVVASLVILPASSYSSVVFAFAGAAAGGAIVYMIASSGGMTPVKLALSGMAVHLFLSSMTQAIIILNESGEDVLYWMTGAIDGSNWQDVMTIAPLSVIGIGLALVFSGPVSVLGLGDETAKGLGQNMNGMRILISFIILLLSGASVAVAGPIGFVGLLVPHIVRKLIGENYKYVLPFSALFGAILLVYADVLARWIAFPYESPVGIVTAIIGTPFFLYLARKGRNLK